MGTFIFKRFFCKNVENQFKNKIEFFNEKNELVFSVILSADVPLKRYRHSSLFGYLVMKKIKCCKYGKCY